MADEPINPEVPEYVISLQNTINELKGLNENTLTELSTVRQELDSIKNPPVPEVPIPLEYDPENRPIANYKEMRREIDERAEKKALEITKTMLEQADQEKKRIQEDIERKNAQDGEAIDRQLQELEKSGKISPIKNAADMNDQGNADRRELLGMAVALKSPDIAKVAEFRQALRDSGKTFDFQTGTISTISRFNNTPPPVAPVGSSSAQAGVGAGGPKVDYGTLHNRSLDDLLKMAGN